MVKGKKENSANQIGQGGYERRIYWELTSWNLYLFTRKEGKIKTYQMKSYR